MMAIKFLKASLLWPTDNLRLEKNFPPPPLPMTTSNPALGAFGKVGAMGINYGNSTTMTVDGTISKTGILGVILLLGFGFTWSGLSATNLPAELPIIVGAIGGLVLAMIIIFKPTTAPYLSPVYACVEGMILAAISFPLELAYPHIVLQAASLTFATLFALLLAYRTGLIVVNSTFRSVVVGATMAIALYYVIGLVCSLFHFTLPGLGFQGGWLSIGISVVVVIVAALNLVLDFDFIAQNAGTAPKYMEWYGAFSLIVTLVWLYLEFLRLLAKLRGRD
jgi:uncharacterized YccA/Bax inhibitor family protein